MDPNQLWPQLANGYLWLILGGASVFGVVGALLHPPAAPSGVPDAGPPSSGAPPPVPGSGAEPTTPPPRWSSALSGAVSAVALLYVTNPTTGTALVGGSLVAGFAANAVLAALQSRTIAAIATRDAAASMRTATELKRQSDANARLADERNREAMQATQELDQLARAAQSGIDIKPLVIELRAKHGSAASVVA